MRAFLDPRQSAHDPRHFMANGVRRPNPEQPKRIEVLKAGAETAGCQFDAPTDHGQGPIAAIHSAEYLRFLETIYPRWQRIDGAADEVIPNVFPDNRLTASYPKSAIGQAGFHQADTACPIGPDTWNAAYWSAQTALSAAKALLSGERNVYALCRPPGHHAFADLAGGFCFLNNSAIAAAFLARHGKRPAIVDIDVHHGNGTQGIFYARNDVFTSSVHADPARFYPFFWGHAHERGTGAGLGSNLNLPLPRGSDDTAFLAAIDTALAHTASFGADSLVVALGLDAHESDPLQGLSVTTDGFGRAGALLKSASLPTVLIQEGGYLSDALGENLTHVLSPFQD